MNSIKGVRRLAPLLCCAAAITLISGCSPSASSSSESSAGPKTVTRWKYTPKSPVGIPKGLVIEQSGNLLAAQYYDLKDGAGFEIASRISRGKYFPAKREFVFPSAQLTPEEIDQLIAMDVGRTVVRWDAQAEALQGEFIGRGVPRLVMEFVRVKE